MACHIMPLTPRAAEDPERFWPRHAGLTEEGSPRHPAWVLPASCLLPPVIDTAFLFVFSVRGKNALIYIKW